MGMSQAQLNELGRVIHRARDKAKLTQRTLAERAGVSHATIWHLECGDFKRPDPDKLQRIAQALGLEIADLFALVGYVPAESLPSFGTYLRVKWSKELSAKDRKALERDFERHRGKQAKTTKKGARA
jgi:transcriptional regulator with XRE-family HTH domain